jgi:hypothetical protein
MLRVREVNMESGGRVRKKRKIEIEMIPLLKELWIHIARLDEWNIVWVIATTCKGLFRCFTGAETVREMFEWFFKRSLLEGRPVIDYLPSWLFKPLPFVLTGCCHESFSSRFRSDVHEGSSDVKTRLSSLVQSVGKELDEIFDGECNEFMVSKDSVSQIIFGKEWQCDKDVWIRQENYKTFMNYKNRANRRKEGKCNLNLVFWFGFGIDIARSLYNSLYKFELSIEQHGIVATRGLKTSSWTYEEYVTLANIYTRDTGIVILNMKHLKICYNIQEDSYLVYRICLYAMDLSDIVLEHYRDNEPHAYDINGFLNIDSVPQIYEMTGSWASYLKAYLQREQGVFTQRESDYIPNRFRGYDRLMRYIDFEDGSNKWVSKMDEYLKRFGGFKLRYFNNGQARLGDLDFNPCEIRMSCLINF